MRDTILPTVTEDSWDEILVVGVWEEYDEDKYNLPRPYKYLPLQPRYRDRRDALWQRDFGTRHSTGEILVYSHDDHVPEGDFCDRLRSMLMNREHDWDILVPRREHGSTGEELNNGHAKWSAADGRPEPWIGRSYMGGHVCVFRRWVPATIPWTVLDTEFWDLPMSELWIEAGATIRHTDDLVHLDLEAGRDER